MPENENPRKLSGNLSEAEKQERINELRKLLLEDDKLKFMKCNDDSFLARFLNGVHFDVQKAFEKIKLYYEVVAEYPDWFRTESPLSKKDIIEAEVRVAIPATDREGRPIYIAKMGKVNVDKMSMLDVISVDDIWLEHIFSNSSKAKGLCIILDVSNYPWKMIKWLTPTNIKVGVRKLQTLPVGDFMFHVVNSSLLIHASIKIVWPFLPQYIKDVVIFHFDNRESLYKHVDPEVLPTEYGGKNKTVVYSEQYEHLYKKNDIIVENLRNQRTLKIIE